MDWRIGDKGCCGVTTTGEPELSSSRDIKLLLPALPAESVLVLVRSCSFIPGRALLPFPAAPLKTFAHPLHILSTLTRGADSGRAEAASEDEARCRGRENVGGLGFVGDAGRGYEVLYAAVEAGGGRDDDEDDDEGPGADAEKEVVDADGEEVGEVAL